MPIRRSDQLEIIVVKLKEILTPVGKKFRQPEKQWIERIKKLSEIGIIINPNAKAFRKGLIVQNPKQIRYIRKCQRHLTG
jgi:hypothetical protein